MNTEQSSIAPYKPNPSVAQAFTFDEKLPEEELTFDVFKKLVLARKTQDLVFLHIGRMLKLFRDRKLYKNLDFDNFSQFLASEEIAFSREKAYMYIRIFELYVEKLELSSDNVAELGVVRLNMMIPIVKDMNKEDAIEALEGKKDIRYGDFVREVKNATNKDGKPSVYFSVESSKWIVNYYDNTTLLMPLGKFNHEQED